MASTHFNKTIIERYTFVIMDFEFTRWHGENIVLVSGAIANYQKRTTIIRLQGNPLVLYQEKPFKKFNRKRQGELMRYVSNTLRSKPVLLESFLNEIERSVAIPERLSTLNSEYILNYLNKKGKQSILVFWNGSNDLDVLHRLRISVSIILDISTYNDYGDDQYFLKLYNSKNKELLFSRKIVCIEKKGRQLSLEETHSSICKINHRITTNVHDPSVDVLYTRCIFNFILNKEGYNSILYKAISMH